MPEEKPKRNHSLGGCNPCRNRHVKCDELRPSCKRCQRCGLACDFTPIITWIDYFHSNPRLHEEEDPYAESAKRSSRRPLYTEYARKYMSSALVSAVSHNLKGALERVDNAESLSHEIGTDGVRVGPFSVFRCVTSSMTQIHESQRGKQNTPLSPEEYGHGSQHNYAGSYDSILATQNSALLSDPGIDDLAKAGRDNRPLDLQESTYEANQTVVYSQTYQDLIFSHWDSIEFDDIFLSEPLDTLQWDDLFPLQISSTPQDDRREASTYPNASTRMTPGYERIPSDIGTEPLSAPPRLSETIHTPEELQSLHMEFDASSLLHYFDDEVIERLGGLPVNVKSSWRILNLPSAIITLDQLSAPTRSRTKLKHANLANFYGITALSAYHLGINPITDTSPISSTDNWLSVSAKSYDAAKHHLLCSLATECSLPNKAKYKDQLMAIAAILAAAYLSGDVVDAKKYLTEMERLIRTRGLTKTGISRKARLLHNVYAWIRINSESTHVLHGMTRFTSDKSQKLSHLVSNSAEPVTQHFKNLIPDAEVDDFLHLESFTTHAQEVSGGQSPSESNLKDIHMIFNSPEHDDMHMQIYGVPEAWLRLVSQTTRVANVTDALLFHDRMGGSEKLCSDLQFRVQALEAAVCEFASNYGENSISNLSITPHEYMVRALSSALLIFFYRRVKRIHPIVLQSFVWETIRALKAFNEALQLRMLPGPGTAWPAFIAGAEALNIEQQNEIASWLDQASQRSGWASYGTCTEILRELWEDRKSGSGLDHTWVDVCRKRKKWPLLG